MSINYADDLLVNMSDTGMTPDLQQLVYDDVQLMSDLGVGSDRERNLLFYLDNFCDDLCQEFGHQGLDDRKKIIAVSFKNLKGKEDIDLTKIREAVYKAIKSLFKKKAYPNTMGVGETNAKPQRDVDKWVKALGEIYIAMRKGEGRESASQRVMEGWSPMDKLDFDAWARYYEAKDHEKYGIKVTAAAVEVPSMERQLPPEMVPEEPVPANVPDNKKALISRLNAAERLLAQFAEVWDAATFNRLYRGLADLKGEIFTLKSASMIEDCIIRTAGMWERDGFIEGAEILKIAQPPEDLATQIERALKGKEYGGKSSPAPAGGEMAPPMEGMEGMEGLGGPMPPPGELEGMEGMEPPAGAGEELPPPEKPPEPPKKEKKEPKVDEDNPFAGQTVQDVLEILEPLSKKLSERQFVRSLSKADMILDSLNIASHFPELGEATAKALELNIYVGTRISKVVEKLKGGIKEDKEEEKPAPPSVEMEEFTGEKPGGGIEEEAFEVAEETPPPPPAAPPARGK